MINSNFEKEAGKKKRQTELPHAMKTAATPLQKKKKTKKNTQKNPKQINPTKPLKQSLTVTVSGGVTMHSVMHSVYEAETTAVDIRQVVPTSIFALSLAADMGRRHLNM